VLPLPPVRRATARHPAPRRAPLPPRLRAPARRRARIALTQGTGDVAPDIPQCFRASPSPSAWCLAPGRRAPVGDHASTRVRRAHPLRRPGLRAGGYRGSWRRRAAARRAGWRHVGVAPNPSARGGQADAVASNSSRTPSTTSAGGTGILPSKITLPSTTTAPLADERATCRRASMRPKPRRRPRR
jgi:hypothetical protein